MAVLSWSWEDPQRAGLRNLYKDLLRLRRTEPGLWDYRFPATHLLEAGDVLEFSRGQDEEHLRIVFNLRGEERALPTDLASERPCFRSEVSKYGADTPEADERFTHLRPYEFQIFRTR